MSRRFSVRWSGRWTCPRRGPECHYLSKTRTTGSILTCARCLIPNFCASTRPSCGRLKRVPRFRRVWGKAVALPRYQSCDFARKSNVDIRGRADTIAVACKRTVECRLCSRGKRICSATGRQACAEGIVGHDQLSHRVVPSVCEPCALLIRQLNSFETARVRGRRGKECPRRRLPTTDYVTYSGVMENDVTDLPHSVMSASRGDSRSPSGRVLSLCLPTG